MPQGYKVKYPKEVILEDGTKTELTIKDNLSRNIVINTKISYDSLKNIFSKVGFKEVLLERKKQGQIGRGMRKQITKYCDIHIRFLKLKENEISIDAEVEVSRKYFQHLKTNILTVVDEVENVLQKFNVKFKLFHKGYKKYIEKVIEENDFYFYTPTTLFDLKFGIAGLVFAIVLIVLK
ncbi:hypothetical protein HRbin34_00425 [bacterium HR34]|nr:hypothetical protein HRbin34_00425 [bacterium HR34]